MSMFKKILVGLFALCLLKQPGVAMKRNAEDQPDGHVDKRARTSQDSSSTQTADVIDLSSQEQTVALAESQTINVSDATEEQIQGPSLQDKLAMLMGNKTELKLCVTLDNRQARWGTRRVNAEGKVTWHDNKNHLINPTKQQELHTKLEQAYQDHLAQIMALLQAPLQQPIESNIEQSETMTTDIDSFVDTVLNSDAHNPDVRIDIPTPADVVVDIVTPTLGDQPDNINVQQSTRQEFAELNKKLDYLINSQPSALMASVPYVLSTAAVVIALYCFCNQLTLADVTAHVDQLTPSIVAKALDVFKAEGLTNKMMEQVMSMAQSASATAVKTFSDKLAAHRPEIIPALVKYVSTWLPF